MKSLMSVLILSSVLLAQEGKKSDFERGFERGAKSCHKKFCFCEYTYGRYPANFRPIVVIGDNSYPLSAAMSEYHCQEKLSDFSVCRE